MSHSPPSPSSFMNPQEICMVYQSREKNKSRSCMSQILGSRCALQDLVGEHFAGHSLRLWREYSEKKSFLSPVSASCAHTPSRSAKTRRHHHPTAPLRRENSFLSVVWEELSAPIRPVIARDTQDP